MLAACTSPEKISIYGDEKALATGLHTVEAGESVYSIAQRYGISRRSLIEANRLEPPYRLNAGMQLRIPEPNYHLVVRGDTVSEIAEKYGVRMGALASLNDLESPYLIHPGDRLRLPGAIVPLAGSRSPALADGRTPEPLQTASTKTSAGRALAPVPAPKPSANAAQTAQGSAAGTAATRDPAVGQEASATPKTTASGAKPSRAAPVPAAQAGRFIWPVRGKVISGFGSKGGGIRNDGINLAVSRGTPVRAAQGGTVAYAGNELRGFGNIILLKHEEDFMTVYAHNEKILVRDGQKVRQGEPIALAGSSGSAARPQLHFEIRKKQKAVNPLRHLGRPS